MSRSDDLKAIEKMADKIEPTIEARFLRAAAHLENAVDLEKLTLALAKGDEEAALRSVITPTRMREAMAPVNTSITQTLNRGGHFGAKQLNRYGKS